MQTPYVHIQDNIFLFSFKYFFSIFIEIDYSLTIHPDITFSFLYSFQLPYHLPSLPDPCQILFCFRKGQALTSKQDKTKYNNLRQMSFYQGCTGQPNRRKYFLKCRQKIQRYTYSQLIRIPPKHQENSHNIDVEDLMQTHTGPILAASVSVSPCDAWLLESLTMFPHAPSTLIPTIFLLFHRVPRSLKGRTWLRPAM